MANFMEDHFSITAPYDGLRYDHRLHRCFPHSGSYLRTHQWRPSRSSTVLLFELWLQRFEYQDIGISAAITVIFVVVLLAFTVTNFVVSERKEA